MDGNWNVGLTVLLELLLSVVGLVVATALVLLVLLGVFIGWLIWA